MDQFSMRPLKWTCSCGTPRQHVIVHISSLQELVAQWKCDKCEMEVMATVRLEDLITGVPPHPNKQLLPPSSGTSPEYTADDLKLMAKMQISPG